MLIALHCSSKAQKKELLKHLKPDTIKTICECAISIINKNIKVSDPEKGKSTKIAIRFENSGIQEHRKRRGIQEHRTRPWKFGGSPLEGYHRRTDD